MKPFDVYSVFDINIVRAEGARLWDSSGNEYLDLYGGHAVISVGHSHPDYVSALTGQLKQIGFYSNSILMPLQEELSEKLGRMSGYSEYSLFLCNSGAEANENAFKLASFSNGRKKIIAFEKGFHGRTSLAVASTDNPAIVSPLNSVHDVCLLPLNDSGRFADAIGPDVAAVIIEGIQGVGGVHLPDPAFLKHVETLCNQHGVVLILDEVQSGYGRSGRFFAHQYSGIKPHLITVAKGMGNGFPVAGVLIAPEFQAKKEMLGTTFGGNYLACAAAISVLDIMHKESLMKNAGETGAYLMDALRQLPGIKAVRGIGLMIGAELEQPFAAIRNTLLKEHRIFTGSSSDKHTIRILPPLNIGRAEADILTSALKASIQLHTT